ncbi:MAG: hypothetical protein L0Y72_20510 [Gemmataceae bacterium]|nr:hypothetical protein [Gemmataceae bacterium]MCI0741422.1 hypothetical protein [Gemmataceae bacterium]
MRRLLFSLFALCFMGAMAGCCTTHGVCDCDFEDHCSTRAPWIQVSAPSASTGGTHTAENLDTAPNAQ